MQQEELKLEQVAVVNYGNSGMLPGLFLDKYTCDGFVWVDNGKFVNVYRVVK